MIDTILKIFDVKTTNRSWWEIILWWEIRRILYNVIMLLAGCLSFCIGYVTIPLIYLVIGLGLNILYTLSWIVEIILNKYIPPRFSLYTFIAYTILSILFVFGFACMIFLP